MVAQDIPNQFSLCVDLHAILEHVTESLPCVSVQLLMELQKVAFKADDDGGPIRQSLNSFTAEFAAVVDKQLKVFMLC